MISVIVPVYKVEPYLRQCVDSILNQIYQDIEVLLIDDGSPDGCGEICDEYARKDNRVRVFHTENRGLSATRNLGLREANGEYIGFVDSDDWIEPDMYELLLRRIQETGADISVCGGWYEAIDYRREFAFTEAVYTHIESLEHLVDGGINNGVWNKLYCRELFKDISFPEGKSSEDISVMQRVICAADKLVTISAIKYYYRVRPESITKSHSAKALFDYADTHLSRYYFFKDEMSELFERKQDALLQYAAKGISKIWRWWYGCSEGEKQDYKGRIEELRGFSRDCIPLFGNRSWPCYLRLSAVFMRSSCYFAFFLLYWMNQVFRTMKPKRANG